MWREKASSDSRILALALPSVVSNITVPLLNLVDMSLVGHMGDYWFVSAISIGGTIFSMIYWVFAFLRMGTTGIISQAYGAQDEHAIGLGLCRSLLLSLLIGMTLLLLQQPILKLALNFLQTTEGYSLSYAATYFKVCVWGAPAMLSSYSLTGWYIGMHDTRTPMQMAILQNVMNIVASVLAVYMLGWGIAGVAAGTVVGLYSGVLWGCLRLRGKVVWQGLRLESLFDGHQMQRFFQVNRDIFLRTLCLVAVTVYFTRCGARMGELTLSANALLMQFFMFYSYFMDGLANAAEALSGELAGACQWKALHAMVKRLFLWGILVALMFTLLYMGLGRNILDLLTDKEELVCYVRDNYLPWVCAVPLVAMAAFVWDGVFIGLTMTHGMLCSMFLAAVGFFLALWFARPLWGNHGLWFAFLLYLALRGGIQTAFFVMKKADV